MTTLIDDRRVHAAVAAPARYFYVYMALACAAVAFLGFAPTYWVPLAHGTFSASAVVHFHGLLFFTWTLYFAFQSWLAASGRVAWHRALGIVGVSLATAMTIFGFLVSVARDAAIRRDRPDRCRHRVLDRAAQRHRVLRRRVRAAIANTRQPEIHKRLMLLAGISILDAAVARWFLTFLAPPGPPGPPPVPVTIPPAIVAYLLLVVAMVHRLAHARPPAPGLHLWRHRAAGGEAVELADQRDAGLALRLPAASWRCAQ